MSSTPTANGDHRDVFADPENLPRAQSRISSMPHSLSNQSHGSSKEYGSAPSPSSSLPPGAVSPTSGSGPEMNAKLEGIKTWSVSTYKCTKQMIQEKLGKSTRTVDTEMESRIAMLRETQARYRVMHELAIRMAAHFRNMWTTQRGLGDIFTELGQKQPELRTEFEFNSQTQRLLAQNGEHFLIAIDFFTKTLDTLINKTIEDTILTIRNYEKSRVEFDAYRTELETASSASGSRAHEAQTKVDFYRVRFEKLRSDVDVKMKLLDDNRIRVMQKQLLLFNNAISAYFSGNQEALDATMKQFNLIPKNGNSQHTSFLER